MESSALSLSMCYEGLARYFSRNHNISDTPMLCSPTLAHVGRCLPGTCAKATTDFYLADVPTVDTLPNLGSIAECDSSSDHSYCRGLSKDSLSLEQEVMLRMQGASNGVLQWRPNNFEVVSTLQDAPRNQESVVLMRSLADGGGFVAVKQMPNRWVTWGPAEFSRRYPQSAERPWVDIGLVRHLHDQGFAHICTPLGVFRDRWDTFVVSAYANAGDLFSWLTRDPAPGADREEMLRPVMRQLFGAVMQLHDLGVVHRDISLENILVSDEGCAGEPTVKLSDFGMASLSQRCRGSCGKSSYIAPEQRAETAEHDGFLCDGFALGVCLFTLAARAYPWDSTEEGCCKRFRFIAAYGLRAYVARRKAFQNSDLRLAQVLSGSLVDLLEALLVLQPQGRACLGERVYCQEMDLGERASACTMPWLDAQAAALSVHDADRCSLELEPVNVTAGVRFDAANADTASWSAQLLTQLQFASAGM